MPSICSNFDRFAATVVTPLGSLIARALVLFLVFFLELELAASGVSGKGRLEDLEVLVLVVELEAPASVNAAELAS